VVEDLRQLSWQAILVSSVLQLVLAVYGGYNNTFRNLYIADTGNLRVRAVDSDGNITTVAGSGSPGFAGDNGPATQARLIPSDVAVDARGHLSAE